MFIRDEIIKILQQAGEIDFKYELFGASTHRYRLNPPIRASFVREVEGKYGFSLPDDYVQFITEIGDGGAGPDHGIYPFADFVKKGINEYAEKYRVSYRNSLAKPFLPRPLLADEFDDFAIGTKEAYEQNPDSYFVFENPDENEQCDLAGYYVLGTCGCQWDFGLITAGPKYGCVFDTDNEGAYRFEADSFQEFYQNWLDKISDTEGLQRQLEERRKLFQNRR